MSPTIVTEISQLIEQVRSYCPEADEAIIRRAYEFSAKAHEGQTRRSGEPYLQHPLPYISYNPYYNMVVKNKDIFQ